MKKKLHIFSILSSRRHEKRCRICVRLLWLFQCSRNQQWVHTTYFQRWLVKKGLICHESILYSKAFFQAALAIEGFELIELKDENIRYLSILLNYRVFVMQILKVGNPQKLFPIFILYSLKNKEFHFSSIMKIKSGATTLMKCFLLKMNLKTLKVFGLYFMPLCVLSLQSDSCQEGFLSRSGAAVRNNAQWQFS